MWSVRIHRASLSDRLRGDVEWPDASQGVSPALQRAGNGGKTRSAEMGSPGENLLGQPHRDLVSVPAAHPCIQPAIHTLCSGITSIILTGRPYCGCCAVSASGLVVAIPADVLDPRMPPFSMHIWCRRIVSNVHRCSRAILPQAARYQFFPSLSLSQSPWPRAAPPPHPILSATPSRP